MTQSPLKITGQTRITGLLGWPVEHTLSPLLHNYGYQKLGLNFCYLPFPVRPADLPAALVGLKALNIAGCNVTIPHKEAVLPLLDKIDDFAGLAGAVNTIKNDNGRLVGFNTDGPGFMSFLAQEQKWPPAGKKVVIFGAGGAARAVAVSLLMADVSSIAFTEIVFEKAQTLVEDLTAISQKLVKDKKVTSAAELANLSSSPTGLKKAIAEADLLLNASPAGMAPWEKETPLEDFSTISSQHLVVDLVYNPSQTIFLQQAAQQGAKTANGLGMLIHQAVLSFAIMTGQKISPEIMAEGLKDSQ